MRTKRLRRRATAVVVRDGKVLLVKDRGQSHYSLPGGGIRKREPVVAAASRELYEELGLEAIKVTRLTEYDFDGSFNQHNVCLIEANGEPALRQLAVSGFIWWDMKEDIPILSHVMNILGRIGPL